MRFFNDIYNGLRIECYPYFLVERPKWFQFIKLAQQIAIFRQVPLNDYHSLDDLNSLWLLDKYWESRSRIYTFLPWPIKPDMSPLYTEEGWF